jgi:hypothetical protein
MRCHSAGCGTLGPNAAANAIEYAEYRSRSQDAVIRVYDQAGNVIENARARGRRQNVVRTPALAPGGTVAEFICFADAKWSPQPFTLCGSCFFSCVPVATSKSGKPA